MSDSYKIDVLRSRIKELEEAVVRKQGLLNDAEALIIRQRDERQRCLEGAVAHLKDELETERMRLVACGVVALANTPSSAALARDMKDKYKSASLNDVIRMVDENMRLRAELKQLKARQQ